MMASNDDMNDMTEVTFTQMVVASGFSESEVRELVRYGALVPRNPDDAAWTFEARWMFVARKASRLRREFELDTHGVSVVMSFLERIESLEAELRAVRAQLGR